jgi:cell division protein FtsA
MKNKPTNFISMDIGSSKIASMAVFMEKNGDVEVTGQNLHYSEGIKSSVVTDLAQAENSILQAVYTLEQECGMAINEAAISLSGYGTKSYYLHNKIKINDGKISQHDVQKLIQKALAGFNIPDAQVIHYFPVEFSLDSGDVVDDPIGMISHELLCRIHVIAANSNILINLANCLAKCQLEIHGVVLAIYASGIACLTEDEKKLGSLIIDFGARTTSFAIFLGGKMMYSGYVPIGGWHITSDIAKAFSVNFSTAEKLKILYGNASDSYLTSTNPVSLDDGEGNEVNITVGDLAHVINPRVQEILELLKKEYDKVNIDHLISRRVVLTGGGGMLKGLKEMTCQKFAKQVRIAKPKIFHGFAEDYNPGIYSSSIGIVEAYVNRQRKSYNPVLDDYNLQQGYGARILSWFSENI